MIDLIQKEFTLQGDIRYMNHAGVSPWPYRTASAVKQFAEENMNQGSLMYPEWEKIEGSLRIKAKDLINAESKDDIALLKSTSEALSVVAYGLDWKDGENIVSSNQEFPSNRLVWESLADKGVKLKEASLDCDKSPEDALFSLVDGNTRLVTISSVQYSTGLKLDLERIGDFCRHREILFCIDAIQSIGAVQIDVQKVKADFVMADGHKWMLGPEGLALFYCRPEVRNRLKLNQYGWHMVENAGDFSKREWSIANSSKRFECGSPNMIGVHALNASLSLILEVGIDRIEDTVLRKSEYLISKIKGKTNLELLSLDEPGRYAGIITFRRLNADNIRLYRHLMGKKVLCAPRAGGIRLSPHFYTPDDHIDEVIDMACDFDLR